MQSWGMTDPGCVRMQNQDVYLIEELGRGTLMCLVCDGMGGAKSGNVASSLAADVFSQEIKRSWKAGMTIEEIGSMMSGAVKLANYTVFDQANEFEEFNGMGTTLVCAFISGKDAVFINVGDSRAYVINKDGISQITNDHSLVQMMVDRGELSREQARTYPGKNMITRAVGTEKLVRGDLYHRVMEKDDFLLLCSDGLSNVVTDQEMLYEVIHGGSPDTCCQRLLDVALHRGAPDNVTVVLIQY